MRMAVESGLTTLSVQPLAALMAESERLGNGAQRPASRIFAFARDGSFDHAPHLGRCDEAPAPMRVLPKLFQNEPSSFKAVVILHAAFDPRILALAS